MAEVQIKDISIMIEAAVVRVLKRRKIMPKTELSSDVMMLLSASRPKL